MKGNAHLPEPSHAHRCDLKKKNIVLQLKLVRLRRNSVCGGGGSGGDDDDDDDDEQHDEECQGHGATGRPHGNIRVGPLDWVGRPDCIGALSTAFSH